MSDVSTQILIYMSCIFILGLLLGWLVWGFGYAKKLKLLSADANFWQQYLEQSRREHHQDTVKIEKLLAEKQDLKERLSAMAE